MFERKLLHSLVLWKSQEHPKRKPLILHGARQVGKTFLVREFGERNFETTIELNLENSDHARYFQAPLSIKDFAKIIEVRFQKQLVDGKTLVFIDEIQNSIALLKLLRFFYEERPDLHVIAAGSLLSAKLQREGIELPVGRVEYRYLYPLDFFEYLEALGEHALKKELQTLSRDVNLPTALHHDALRIFSEYMAIGGMPELVATYAQTKSFSILQPLYSSLFNAYRDDVYKYATHAEARYIQHVIETVPLHAGNIVSYEKLGGGLYRSRELFRACEILQRAGIITQIYATESHRLPLMAKPRRPKKFLFLDSGLVAYRSGLQGDVLHDISLTDGYRGRLAEQIVGQQLISNFTYEEASIFYWSKTKTQGEAEIDFCMLRESKIIGIEVKSGAAGRLRSLFSFADSVADATLIRISQQPLSYERIEHRGKSYNLISIPFYLVPKVLELI
ncbi:ATP-binding protein [Candidatus Uhrbacteria bacterium]|nr:ATP-binding protein [Candidatus Uhrbacteria bacterium]